ncbi:hypothetical protein EV143_1325 [Flavobacterium chryseum]|uniref:hypothetical protein n=1 Tax=Flavobacterium sp. P3160 TaxID=2512113 RepID=UPI00105EF57B|nr:hypothetical protein [Flavobacterium sp. P3160]TDO67094.1 hypothetical protein EV143_1325 [Flavobacterium sp. P3160]
MATRTIKRKKLKDEIYDIIRNDIPLRHKIGKQLNIEVQSVYQSAARKSTKFSLPIILEVISKHTGLPKEELTNV